MYMHQWRLFIATELPDQIRNALGQAQHELGLSKLALTYVRPGAMHLTLAFLGNVASNAIAPIVACMQLAKQPCGTLRLAKAGAFPSLTRPSIAWVGLSGALTELRSIYVSLQTCLHQLGYPSEHRQYTPHLTLARVRRDASPQERSAIGRALQSLKLEPLAWQPTQLCLYRSELLPGESRYTNLAQVDLT